MKDFIIYLNYNFISFFKNNKNFNIDVEIHKKSADGKYDSNNRLLTCQRDFIKLDSLTAVGMCILVKNHRAQTAKNLHSKSINCRPEYFKKDTFSQKVLWVCLDHLYRTKFSQEILCVSPNFFDNVTIQKHLVQEESLKRFNIFLENLSSFVFHDLSLQPEAEIPSLKRKNVQDDPEGVALKRTKTHVILLDLTNQDQRIIEIIPEEAKISPLEIEPINALIIPPDEPVVPAPKPIAARVEQGLGLEEEIEIDLNLPVVWNKDYNNFD